MRTYIASRSQSAARHIRDVLSAAGHQVTSRWLNVPDYTGMPETAAEKKTAAVQNMEDLMIADVLILRAEPDGSFVPGGKHVETGAALALQKPVIVLGQPENIFHWHPLVRVVPDETGMLAELRRLESSGQA